MNVIKRVWRGEYPLPVMFWGWLVAGQFLLFTCSFIVGLILSGIILNVLGYNTQATIFFIFCGAVFSLITAIPYLVVAVRGTWCSATRYSLNKGSKWFNWGIVAKVAIIAWFLRIGWGLLQMNLPS